MLFKGNHIQFANYQWKCFLKFHLASIIAELLQGQLVPNVYLMPGVILPLEKMPKRLLRVHLVSSSSLWSGYWTYSALLFSTTIHLLVQATSWMANRCLLWALLSELAGPVIFSPPNRPFDYIHHSLHSCISGQFITEYIHQFHQALIALCKSLLIVGWLPFCSHVWRWIPEGCGM